MTRRAVFAGFAGIGWVLLTACGDSPPVVGPPVCSVVTSAAAEAGRLPPASPYDDLFARAGSEFGVPGALLRAISHVETGWRMVEGQEEFHGMPPASGLMALRGERLQQAAALVGLSAREVAAAPEANVRGAAALLRALADAAGVDGDGGFDAWREVVADFGGIRLEAGREAYVRDVRAALDGRRAAPASSTASASCGEPAPAPQPDYVGAVWRASPNYNQRMGGEGGVMHVVIIHSCEGGYTGCWSWLASSSSQVSAHYVIREDGAEITQLVREESRAWHIGAYYDSTLNAGHAGHLHGIQSNHFTIGVEHAGFASQAAWPAEQIDASARLVCDVTRRRGIPRDRFHVVSHAQLQPYNRTDPGANWPWTEYMAKIDLYCAS
jgi:N-acetyl-anhydromuramyl-L-alanine amidase AmpD